LALFILEKDEKNFQKSKKIIIKNIFKNFSILIKTYLELIINKI